MVGGSLSMNCAGATTKEYSLGSRSPFGVVIFIGKLKSNLPIISTKGSLGVPTKSYFKLNIVESFGKDKPMALTSVQTKTNIVSERKVL